MLGLQAAAVVGDPDLLSRSRRAGADLDPGRAIGGNRLRGVLEQADEDLPEAVKVGMAADGRMAAGAVLMALLRQPGQTPALIRTARAAGPALIRALARLDVLDGSMLRALDGYARPPVLGGGEPVGELVADFDLTPA